MIKISIAVYIITLALINNKKLVLFDKLKH